MAVNVEDNPYRAQSAEIIDIKQETDVEYTFRLAANMDLNCGQFLEVSIPGFGEAPISVSDFGTDWLELTIRRVGDLTDKIHELGIGDKLYLRGPYGNGFSLEEFKHRNLIIAAGGTGLAPVRSVINYFYDHPTEVNDFELLMGFKDPDSLLFERDIDRWKEKLEVLITVDQTCGVWGECVGLITEHIPKVNLSDVENTEVIVVGPPLMMKHTIKEFKKLNVPDDKIWVSYERKMHCGLGKCGHCKIEDNYVCVDGPVYNYAEIKDLKD
ncbi:anaerobic sulfite reductase subunit AsrB [Sporohalobacter salinus]|uniref:anaerobic sulfite reductase subunit AsrB n=1 Tax=Sporohalobacter salinus TaxID=1494606 RepID=UPI0030B7FF6A|nr:anaerobic sulfite reductase subunit B [Sporohalobacter salinus]